MYAITNHGHCVVNGLGQVMIFEDFNDANETGYQMIVNGANLGDYKICEIHYVKAGES